MNRRSFLQLAGLAGLGVVAPVAIGTSHADPSRYDGPYWLMLHANGGWDTTLLCDPKGGAIDRGYAAKDIGHAGAIAYAPTVGYANATAGTGAFYSAAEFFDAWHERLLVVNGIDTQTNNHDAGVRSTWSGDLVEGYPSFAALAAGAVVEKRNVPLAFLSYGGYDDAEGVCAVSRVGSAGDVQALAHPSAIDPANPGNLFTTRATASRVAAVQAARLAARRAKATLPAEKTALSRLFLARSGSPGFASLATALASTELVTLDSDPALAAVKDKAGLADLEALLQQAQIAALSFKAGVAVSANLELGGFDTHFQSDVQQAAQLAKLMKGLDYIFTTLDAMGLSDKTYVVVGSDFGRTPSYNAFGGKDHWNIGTMMMAGPTVQGDTVVGATDAKLVGVDVDGALRPTRSSGARITTAEVHLALRRLAKLSGSANDTRFGLAGRNLPFPIFG